MWSALTGHYLFQLLLQYQGVYFRQLLKAVKKKKVRLVVFRWPEKPWASFTPCSCRVDLPCSQVHLFALVSSWVLDPQVLHLLQMSPLAQSVFPRGSCVFAGVSSRTFTSVSYIVVSKAASMMLNLLVIQCDVNSLPLQLQPLSTAWSDGVCLFHVALL